MDRRNPITVTVNTNHTNRQRNNSMKLTRIHHVAVICSDYPRSLEFYTKTLGLRLIAENYRADRKSYKADLAIGDDYVVELFSFPSPPSRVTNPEAAGLRHLAFATDDLDAALADLDKAGIPHEEVRTDEYTGKRFFFFRDPDNLPIEIYEESVKHSLKG